MRIRDAENESESLRELTDVPSTYHSRVMSAPHQERTAKVARPLRHVRSPKLSEPNLNVTKAIVTLIAGLADVPPAGVRKST